MVGIELRVIRLEIVGVRIVRVLVDDRVVHAPSGASIAARARGIELCGRSPT